MTRFEWKRNPNVTISSLKSRHGSFFIKKVVQKAILYIWETVVKKYITKNLQKSPNLVVLSLYLSLSLTHTCAARFVAFIAFVRSFVGMNEQQQQAKRHSEGGREYMKKIHSSSDGWIGHLSLSVSLSPSPSLPSQCSLSELFKEFPTSSKLNMVLGCQCCQWFCCCCCCHCCLYLFFSN